MTKVNYLKDAANATHAEIKNVEYEASKGRQHYKTAEDKNDIENKCLVKYATGGRAISASRSSSQAVRSPRRTASKDRSAPRKSHHSDSSKRHSSKSGSSKSSKSGKSRGASPTASKRCYDVKRGRKRSCHKSFIWQTAKYKRDDCGSGFMPKRFDFLASRKNWCKTPLTMYQASIGELGRQILCREKIVPRDVKPPPPCAVGEYILPPCGGYYRKYDCLRPCEEEYAVVRNGCKQYRDRVQRYWDPCMTKEQKIKMDVDHYAPHNAVLGRKMRRKNEDGVNLPCW